MHTRPKCSRFLCFQQNAWIELCQTFSKYRRVVSRLHNNRFSGGGDRSDTVGGRSFRCLFWVLPKRNIPKPDQLRKDIIHQESLGTDML